MNWGFHHLAYLLPVFRFVLPLLMVAVLFRKVQERLLMLVEGLMKRVSEYSRWGKFAAAVAGIAIMMAFFWWGREATFFLGDGMFAQRSLANIQIAENIPIALQNAPLPGFLTWKLYQFLVAKNVEVANQVAFQLMSVIIGGICLLIMARITRYISKNRVEQALAFIFVLAAATSQLFFGYVENYAPALLSTLLFVLLSLGFLQSRIHLALPSIAFGLMFASHFGMFYMFPALLFLYVLAARRKRWMEIGVALAAMVLSTVGLLYVCGYPPDVVRAIFLKEGGSHIVPWGKLTNGWHAYTMFSIRHLSERLNFYLLIAPFALVLFLVLTPFTVKHLTLRRSQWIFLLIMAVFSLGFTFGINFDIGMSRDWDLLVPYNIALVIAAAYVWFHTVNDQELRQRLMVMMAAVTLLHTAGFVMVNAQVEPSIERFRTLRDPRVWGPAAIIYANEDLGTYYRELGDYQRAEKYYREGLAIDSTNSRRWLAIASVYQSLGQTENYRYALQKAVDTGTRNIQVHIQLGQIALQEGNIDRAIETWKKGLEAEPNALILSYYIGMSLAERKQDYASALPYLLGAGRAFPNEPEVLNAIGSCYYHLGKTNEMKSYWGKLLQIAPNYPQAASIRKLLAQSQ